VTCSCASTAGICGAAGADPATCNVPPTTCKWEETYKKAKTPGHSILPDCCWQIICFQRAAGCFHHSITKGTHMQRLPIHCNTCYSNH
jgi:hypothetical protein